MEVAMETKLFNRLRIAFELLLVLLFCFISTLQTSSQADLIDYF